MATHRFKRLCWGLALCCFTLAVITVTIHTTATAEDPPTTAEAPLAPDAPGGIAASQVEAPSPPPTPDEPISAPQIPSTDQATAVAPPPRKQKPKPSLQRRNRH